MRCNSDDGDYGNPLFVHDFIGTVMPENPVSTGSVVLGVCLEHFFAIDAGQRGEFMRTQAFMLGVHFQVAEGLLNLLKDRDL